ncbi:hypothetical protein A9K55_003890 [Cordyceps militaris]|uniref:F-box domain-containing protein n=1 Tax=Cordyceps militaris TaxID=73501 RepID=A0A2H4SNH4_CORMI|nr:hypothetical protein A9K55_003890 [Cordyceps militaris]
MDVTSPVARALVQPHIVQSICNELPPESLVAAALINRNFFTYATEAKWSEAPLWALAQRVQVSRRQRYASKVRDVALSESQMRKHADALRRVQFDGLRTLLLAHYSSPRLVADDVAAAAKGDDRYHERLHRYLPAGLRALSLSDCHLTDALLRTFRRRCTRLRSLRLDTYWPDFSYDALVAVLAANPLLEDLRLEPRDAGVSPEGELHGPLLVQCARQRKLRALHFGPSLRLPVDALQQIAAEHAAPFPALERLLGVVPSMAIPLLARWCEDMIDMVLNVQDTDVSILEAASKMKKLRRLRVHFVQETTFCKAEILSLQSLSRMESLCLYSEALGEEGFPEFPLTCDEVQTWIACFPLMRELELEVRMTSSQSYLAALMTVASCCPRLERIMWPGAIDFTNLNLPLLTRPLFPSLQLLHVAFARTGGDRKKFPENCAEEEVTEIIRKHFPKLYRFVVEHKNDTPGILAIKKAFRSYERLNHSAEYGWFY